MKQLVDSLLYVFIFYLAARQTSPLGHNKIKVESWEKLTEVFCESSSGELRSPSCPPYSSSCDAVGHASKSVCPRSCRYWNRGEFCKEKNRLSNSLGMMDEKGRRRMEMERHKIVPDGRIGVDNVVIRASVWCEMS